MVLFDLILLEYVALYTYESPESGDLTFCAEDVVLVTEREGEWWRGCIGDQSGLFPSNYVKPKEPDVCIFRSFFFTLTIIVIIIMSIMFFCREVFLLSQRD